MYLNLQTLDIDFSLLIHSAYKTLLTNMELYKCENLYDKAVFKSYHIICVKSSWGVSLSATHWAFAGIGCGSIVGQVGWC